MRKKTIKAMIKSINNIDYEIFNFGELVKKYEKLEKLPFSSDEYIKMLYGIRYGTMLELEEKIKKLRKELKKTINENKLAERFDIGFKP